jgi:hypothetical protein
MAGTLGSNEWGRRAGETVFRHQTGLIPTNCLIELLVGSAIIDPATDRSVMTPVTDANYAPQNIDMATLMAAFVGKQAVTAIALNFGTAAAAGGPVTGILFNAGATLGTPLTTFWFYLIFASPWTFAAGSPILVPPGYIGLQAGEPN